MSESKLDQPNAPRLNPQSPIGVFDSGLGGLTVVRALRETLPSEDIVYLGDTARVPYGTRSASTVIRYARGCARLLTGHDIKMLIVACNTASAVALDMLRAEFDLPVVGVIEPGAQAAVEAAEQLAAGATVVPKIGVLGTASTIGSGAYPRAVASLTTRYEVCGQAAPLLVPLVEEGWLEGQVPELAIERYLTPVIDQGSRVVVLGCTHYPLVGGLIEATCQRLSPEPTRVVDSAHATANHVATLLADRELLNHGPLGKLSLLVTDLPASFHAVAARFLGGELPEPQQVDIVAA